MFNRRVILISSLGPRISSCGPCWMCEGRCPRRKWVPSSLLCSQHAVMCCRAFVPVNYNLHTDCLDATSTYLHKVDKQPKKIPIKRRTFKNNVNNNILYKNVILVCKQKQRQWMSWHLSNFSYEFSFSAISWDKTIIWWEISDKNKWKLSWSLLEIWIYRNSQWRVLS